MSCAGGYEVDFDEVHLLIEGPGKPKYTEFPKTGHGAWTPAYNSAALWAWMFSQRRAKS
ncbi:MAG: hypothetical protein VCA55_05800 [Verrucomicrobiales bacterium]